MIKLHEIIDWWDLMVLRILWHGSNEGYVQPLKDE